MVFLSILMCIGLQGKVEYMVQYDGAPLNPMSVRATPINWTLGDDVEDLKKGFTKHRNVCG